MSPLQKQALVRVLYRLRGPKMDPQTLGGLQDVQQGLMQQLKIGASIRRRGFAATEI